MNVDAHDILFTGGIIATIVFIARKNKAEKQFLPVTNQVFVSEEFTDQSPLVYDGDELHFTDELIITVLNKHFSYFKSLSYDGKLRFLERLKKFISLKTFVIYDKSGFREMPILISATAIMLSMGLQEFTLSHYSSIHIFPAAFIGVHPTLRVLSGNVSGDRIHISWKHFLEGYSAANDGQNVGMHEMAHAYQYQNVETEQNGDSDFADRFDLFVSTANQVMELEKNSSAPFYSSYGLTNMQEFWAESVELFFERSVTFQENYPGLYAAIVHVLQQDPLDTVPIM